LWAVGTLFALVTIALLVALLAVNREAVKWEDLSRARIEQVALIIGIAVALTTLFVLLAIGGATLGWTGFGDKTFWDWLQLLSALAIPVVLAAAGLWFTAQQDLRQQNIENERAQQAQKIENQRAEAERELAEQRAQDEALQAYLDQMSHLLLEKDLRGSKEDGVVRTLARARTAAVIQRLDGPRNRTVIRFLNEAHLIGKGQASIRLLAGADLKGAGLYKVDLGHTYLHKANLSRTNLGTANLSGADLYDADLSRAVLEGANLRRASLRRANLSDKGSRVIARSGVNLRAANLGHAWLDDADLRRARHVTDEQLEKAETLAGATMPDGQTLKGGSKYFGDEAPNGPTFEEWRKGKKAQLPAKRGFF
jgi:uncharacterized protein YjbI with pentapeptide repeats